MIKKKKCPSCFPVSVRDFINCLVLFDRKSKVQKYYIYCCATSLTECAVTNDPNSVKVQNDVRFDLRIINITLSIGKKNCGFTSVAILPVAM